MHKATRTFVVFGVLFALAISVATATRSLAADSTAAETARLLAQFQRYCGARLVFDADDLPPGRYHDIMLPLSQAKRRAAAEICLREVKKYPPNYLGEMGLEAIGVFAVCASRDGDGYRPFDREIGGYRYYGIWNGGATGGRGGIAAAYYTDGQLPLTFHHEIFHHVDGTRGGICDAARFFASDDRQFAAAVEGTRRYAALEISENDRNKLRRLRDGYVLKDSVSDYASKAHGEDQAETARYFMTALPDALLQMAERPELPGSQRMLHCLAQFAVATDKGPDAQWFVDVALGRAEAAPAEVKLAAGEDAAADVAPAAASKALRPTLDDALAQLREYARAGESGWDGVAQREDEARRALSKAAELDLSAVPSEKATAIAIAAAELTHRLLRYRLRASGDDDARYAIWGGEDENGVNWTLRRDLQTFGEDALRLQRLARGAPNEQDAFTRTHIKNLRLVARYYAYIKEIWSVSGGTQEAFNATRDAYADALARAQPALADAIRQTDLDELAGRLPADGAPKLREGVPARPRFLPPRSRENTFLVNVNREVHNPDRRAAIRRVQPACVRVPGGSGCCVSPRGAILTAAHVARKLGRKVPVTFPDGTTRTAKCTAISEHLDLALLEIDRADHLPYAPISPNAPGAGSWICAIGQPGSTTPAGEPTGYGAFHVSTGRIRGFQGERLAPQALGGVKHDAWTYWGHSGCPLFNERGEIVSMHNSWDSTTAMRHGVTHEAIRYFLKQAKVDFAMAE